MIYISILFLSFLIGIIITTGLLIKIRYTQNYDHIVSEKLGKPDITMKTMFIMIFILIPLEVFVLSYMPDYFLQYGMISAGFLLLSFTGYVSTHNRTGLLLGPIYILLYTYWWNVYTLNLVAVMLAVGAILLVNINVKWDHIRLFAILIVIVDVFLVYITKDMIDVAQKIMLYELPNMLIIPARTYPAALGLGDVLLAGLLCLKISEEKQYSMNKTTILIWTMCFLTIPFFVLLKLYFPGGAPGTVAIVAAFVCSYPAIHLFDSMQKNTAEAALDPDKS